MLKLFFYTLLVFLQSYGIQDISKEQVNNLLDKQVIVIDIRTEKEFKEGNIKTSFNLDFQKREFIDSLESLNKEKEYLCLLYTSPSPRDGLLSRMPSSA